MSHVAPLYREHSKLNDEKQATPEVPDQSNVAPDVTPPEASDAQATAQLQALQKDEEEINQLLNSVISIGYVLFFFELFNDKNIHVFLCLCSEGTSLQIGIPINTDSFNTDGTGDPPR
jgi:hypothetical protein